MKPLLQDLQKNKTHYLVLLFILFFGALAFFYFRQFPQAQILSVFLTATFYVLWGIVHHYLQKDLHLRIILEYLAVAIFGFLIVWSVIIRR